VITKGKGERLLKGPLCIECLYAAEQRTSFLEAAGRVPGMAWEYDGRAKKSLSKTEIRSSYVNVLAR